VISFRLFRERLLHFYNVTTSVIIDFIGFVIIIIIILNIVFWILVFKLKCGEEILYIRTYFYCNCGMYCFKTNMTNYLIDWVTFQKEGIIIAHTLISTLIENHLRCRFSGINFPSVAAINRYRSREVRIFAIWHRRMQQIKLPFSFKEKFSHHRN